jgi:predicted deacylase
VCLTAGVHGDELNGIEIVRAVFEKARPDALSGTLIGVPVANLHGFRRSSRYLPDRRDLNRFFPGHPNGSSASRIAWSLFDGVTRLCDALVDFHSGSFHRANLPQLRANLESPASLTLARAFGGGVVVHSAGAPGTLRRAANDVGIPAVTYEAGEPMRFERTEIGRGVDGVHNVLVELGMLEGRPRPLDRQQVYHRSRWVRVNDGGIFLTDRTLGERVERGDVLGSVTDPVSNHRSDVIAPFAGQIIGMAVPQVVIPGYAAFHLGIDDGGEALEPAPARDALAPAPVPTPDQLDIEEQPE